MLRNIHEVAGKVQIIFQVNFIEVESGPRSVLKFEGALLLINSGAIINLDA